jgi:hypothetical protein
VLGVYSVGEAVHVLLFVAAMLLLLGVLKARDAALTPTRESDQPSKKA